LQIVCPVCNGRGQDPEIALGLGQHGLMPAYTLQDCCNCGGSGFVDDGTSNYTVHSRHHKKEIKHKLPDSFILKWLRERA